MSRSGVGVSGFQGAKLSRSATSLASSGNYACIAAAYSWLPRNNPTASPTEMDFDALRDASDAAIAVPPGDVTKMRAARQKVLEQARVALRVGGKDSIVTISKVLHFWLPTFAPMIDVNVKYALKELMSATPPPRILTRQGYLWYWELADALVEAAAAAGKPALNYRRLDEMLFLLGRPLKEAADAQARGKAAGNSDATFGTDSRRGDKTRIARELFAARYPSLSRAAMIELFVAEAAMTPKSAASAYQTLLAAHRARQRP